MLVGATASLKIKKSLAMVGVGGRAVKEVDEKKGGFFKCPSLE